MRNDMDKVVTERPRRGGHGGGKSRKRQAQRIGFDEMPTRESMTAPWQHDRKHPRARLNPLRRFLGSRVGRPWNDVYCEIRRTIEFNKWVLIDALDYIRVLYVETHVQLIDGVPHDMRGYQIWSREFWVHPDTGILMAPPVEKRRRYKPAEPDFRQVPIDQFHKYVEIKGLWYLVEFEAIKKPLNKDDIQFDIVLGEFAYFDRWCHSKFAHQWGANIIAVHKRQVGKSVIRRQIKPHLEKTTAS